MLATLSNVALSGAAFAALRPAPATRLPEENMPHFNQNPRLRVGQVRPIRVAVAVAQSRQYRAKASGSMADIPQADDGTVLTTWIGNRNTVGDRLNMHESVDDVCTLENLRAFIHRKLCAKENLLEDQFSMTEMQLTRRSRDCGLQFSLHGPRSVRLGAIWASDHNSVYFYDAQGVRYEKVRLKHRLRPETVDELTAA